MRLLTIKEIAALDPGEVVPAFRAQIKEVKDYKTGQNDYGPWSIQAVTLLDGSGVIKAKIFGQPEYTRQWQGVWIVIESTPSDKGTLRGIKVAADDYRGKVTKFVEVKEGATISQATADAPPAEAAAIQPAKMPPPAQAAPPVQQPPPQQPSQPATTQAPPQQAAAPERQQATVEDVRRQIAAAKERLGQAANGLILCYDAALYVANEVSKKHQEVVIPLFGPDQIEKIAVHLSIALERGGLVFGLPVGPLDAWTKRAKASPPEPPVDHTGGEGGVG